MTAAASQANGKAHRAPVVTVNPPTTIHDLALSTIDESPTNPRKTFTGLDELAEDIKHHGVLQHVLVRPHPKKGDRFELVFGARRFRAAKLAKLTSVPAVLRDLTDAQVLELQIVENSQRSDIHPLEEADGYRALHETHGYTVEEISAKVGKSTSAVYARMKLCALVPEARKAFVEGKLTAATALIVARIPHDDLQRKALAEVARETFTGEPVSARDAAHLVQRKFMLRLVDASFDRADAQLVGGAPACSACPKRTGNQRELFTDVDPKDDLCTDPKCFQSKLDAAWAKRVETAKAGGQTVLSAKQAKEVFGAYGSTFVAPTSGYVDLGAKTWDGTKERTNRALLGKTELPVVLARDPNGGIRELVDAKAFAKATKQAAPAKPSKAEQRYEADREAERKKRERERVKQAAEIAELVKTVERRQPTDAFWRTLASATARALDFEVLDAFERRAIPLADKDRRTDEVVLEVIGRMTGAEARGFVVELLVSCGTSYGEERNADAFRALYAAKKKPAKTKPAKAAKKGGKR